MQVSSGVISGLSVSLGSLTTLNVATGHIFQDSVFGTLEASSGVTLSLPSSGTRTDLLVAYYSELLDSVSSGFVLLDVSLGTESIEENPTRQFGSVVIQQLTNTTYATRPADKIPLYEIGLDSFGVTSLIDVRVYARIQRLQEDIQQNFKNMFFSGF